MKFTNKLFFSMTAMLTVIFMVFGMWMLSSYHNKAIDREMERADMESGMFQLLFENTYFAIAEYGEEYVVPNVMGNIGFAVEKNDNYCMVWTDKEEYYRNAFIDNMVKKEMHELAAILMGMDAEAVEKDNYVTAIRQVGEKYVILSVCRSGMGENGIFLGMCRDITELYNGRQKMVNQYCILLLILLLAGGTFIYIMCYYITNPIRNLNAVVSEISKGNYEKRCKITSSDEIGALAEDFNEMADRIVTHMQEKELEAKQKESFTTAFAHELKTPLTSIIGYADMLNTVEMTEKEKSEAYYYIFTQGKRLESLSHKLLELTQIGRETIKTNPVSMKDLETNIRATMKPIFSAKNIKGKITLEKYVLQADKELLLSVFYNLLDNSVKAVEEGGVITLKGTVLPEGYEVKVTDNGRGIPADEIGRVTEAFYMVDKSRSRKEGGAGIGMTLCQKIVEVHGGRMNIYSHEGTGCLVQILFPKGQTEEGGSSDCI